MIYWFTRLVIRPIHWAIYLFFLLTSSGLALWFSFVVITTGAMSYLMLVGQPYAYELLIGGFCCLLWIRAVRQVLPQVRPARMRPPPRRSKPLPVPLVAVVAEKGGRINERQIMRGLAPELRRLMEEDAQEEAGELAVKNGVAVHAGG